ncbi:hypothetical protein Tco_1042269 [Tanacetum coccineum]|uniref:Uncharacterized protein n=1 Tax=Tanacetum coccineum TaxID=301880 RepID=A0ABQ5GK17_9ASTR
MTSMKMEKPVKETAKPSAAKSSASKAAPKKPAQAREPRKKPPDEAQPPHFRSVHGNPTRSPPKFADSPQPPTTHTPSKGSALSYGALNAGFGSELNLIRTYECEYSVEKSESDYHLNLNK